MSVRSSKAPALKKQKKKKKKILRQQPKQKSAFRLKTTNKPQTFKPKPKLKHKPLPKSKPIPKPKTKSFSQNQLLNHYGPHQDPHSSGSPSESRTTRISSQSHLRTKSRRATNQKQNLSRSGPPQARSNTLHKFHLKSKSRRTLSPYQNTSQPMTSLLRPHPVPQFRPQQVWDTSVQAAIRVGDWKLLTGDPGHGDWVPPQVM